MNTTTRVSGRSSKTVAGSAKPASPRATQTPAPALARRPPAAKAATPEAKLAAKAVTPPRKAMPAKAAPKRPAIVKASTPQPAPAKKTKLVDVTFTMSEAEYKVLGEVKKACAGAGYSVKKNELLRVGMVMLKSLDQDALKRAVAGLAPLKPIRPKRDA